MRAETRLCIKFIVEKFCVENNLSPLYFSKVVMENTNDDYELFENLFKLEKQCGISTEKLVEYYTGCRSQKKLVVWPR